MTDTMTYERLLCPDCRSDNTQCCECGNWTDRCTCADVEEVWCSNCSIVYYASEACFNDCLCDTRLTDNLICDECGVYRESVNDPWYSLDLYDEDDLDCLCKPQKAWACDKCNLERNLITGKWELSAGSTVRNIVKCRHYDVELEFPDGTSVYASSKLNRSEADIAPDFGLYLDSYWYPSCPAYLVDWPDYGLPIRWEVAARCIIDTYKKATAGLWVEIGCIGGHGRTGTVLACMGVLSGLPHEEAIDYVRNFYCNQAIESDEQEWFVEWFDKFVNGGTMTVKTSTILGKVVTPDEDHELMYDGGRANWQEQEMIYASGLRPEESISEVSKRTIVVPPKSESDDKTDQAVLDYCEECNMAGPCLCSADSEKLNEQLSILVAASQTKYDTTWEDDPF